MTLIDTRRFPFKHSTKPSPNNTTVMTHPDAEGPRLPSRLKRMSDATVRGLSRPLSLISSSSSRASTPGAREKSRHSSSRASARNSVSTRASRSERVPSRGTTSRAPSAASTRMSSMGPMSAAEGNNAGELPVFGIAQRAYLASLVSLFSDGKGGNPGHDRNSSHLTTPVSTADSAATGGPSSTTTTTTTNTNTTTSSGGAQQQQQPLGPYEYELGSAAVYKYPRSRALYVGRPGAVRPPPEALLEFEMEALPTLERELHGVAARLGGQGVRVTYELRMSGYARAGAGADKQHSSSSSSSTVALAPTVWILYRAATPAGRRAAVAALHQAVAEIFYLTQGFEIQEGGGRIELVTKTTATAAATAAAAGDDQQQQPRPPTKPVVRVRRDEGSAIRLSDGGSTLSVHTEDCQEKPSVCGARCCVTIDEGAARSQSLCRIGGLLKVNGKYILGVSTAHAMLDGCSIFRDSFDDVQSPPPASHVPPHQHQDHHHPHGQEGQECQAAVDRDRLAAETADVARWHDVTRDAAVDFLGVSMNSRGEMAINRAKPDTATDFSLLRLKKMPGYVRNTYVPPGGAGADGAGAGAKKGAKAVSITSTASAGAAARDEGPVYVLCGGEDVAEGQLVWGSACFIVRGRSFRLRRIQMAKPLSPGTAGAWVVRGEVLYGVIVAVYEHEPYALMMTAERLFASIMASAFSIRSVELWDGEVPEILKEYHKAHEAAKDPKQGPQVKIKSRPVRKSENSLQEAEEEERDSRRKADHDLVIEEINGSSSRTGSQSDAEKALTGAEDHLTDKKSTVIQTFIAPCSSRSEIADDTTQAESSRPPTSQLDDEDDEDIDEDEDDAMDGDEIDGDDLVVRDIPDLDDEGFVGDELDDIKASNPRYPRRPTARSRTLSKASDMTMMSGAVQTPDEPATPEEDEEDGQGAKQAGKTVERYGGSSYASPVTESYFTPRESTSAQAQERLRVGPIIFATMEQQATPTDSRSTHSNSKGVVMHNGSDTGSSQATDNNNNNNTTTSTAITSTTTSNSTTTTASASTTNTKDTRRGSLQNVLGRTFRRNSASSTSTGPPPAASTPTTTAPTDDNTVTSISTSSKKDNNGFGIPPTGLTGRPTLFHRRRSAAAGSALTVSAAAAAVSSSGPGAERARRSSSSRSNRSSRRSSSPDASADISTMLRRPAGRSMSTQEVPRARRDSADSRGVALPRPLPRPAAASAAAAAAAAVVTAGVPAAQPGLGQRPKMVKRLSSGRPFSYGKFEANMKEKNFGIPSHGL